MIVLHCVNKGSVDIEIKSVSIYTHIIQKLNKKYLFLKLNWCIINTVKHIT